MTDRQAIRAKVFEKRLRRKLASCPEAIRAFDAALRDDMDFNPDVSIPQQVWASIAIGLYLKRAGVFWQREALRGAWAYSSWAVSRVAAAERIPVLDLFRSAQFPLSEGMPEEVLVWRGTAGIDKHSAERGLSWTPNRGHACFWAFFMSERMQRGKPLVITRTVPSASILYLDETEHFEEVVFDAEPESAVDTCEGDWLIAAREWRETIPPGFIDPRAEWDV